MVKKTGRIFFVLMVATLTLLPIFNIVRMINYGGNNLSNDYLFSIPTIVKALDGQLAFEDLIVASWYRAHFVPISMITTIMLAYFTNWNTYAEMYFGLVIMMLRLCLLWDLFAQGRKGFQHLLVLPVLSALVFSPIQSSTFTWGGVIGSFGLLLFFGTFGIWGLVRFQGRLLGIGIMVFSGIVASWTWGAGVVVWPLYLIVMLLLAFRKYLYYFIWLGAAGTAAFPYLYFTYRANFQDSVTGSGFNLFNYKTFFELLGAPLTQYRFGVETQILWIVGFAGVIIFVIMFLLWGNYFSNTSFRKIITPMFLILWGGLGAWLISAGRSDIAPWYGTITMNFWIGLVILIFVLLFESRDLMGAQPYQYSRYMAYCIPLLAFIAILFIYLRYNVFSEQYPFYLPSRAPSSAACLRNYRVAPTYCEGAVFQWGVGNNGFIQKMAEPLDKHNLSVFSPHQTWTLQGDYIFNNVQIDAFSSQVSWWTGLGGELSSWRDYRHLDIMLPSPATISWPLTIENNVNKIELRTAVGINTRYQDMEKIGEKVTFIIIIQPEGGNKEVVYKETILSGMRGWGDVQINLDDYIGKKIIIQLSTTSEGGKIGDWAMYRFPIIDIYEGEPSSLSLTDEEIKYRPQNTELSSEFPVLSENDYILDGQDVNLWQITSLEGMPNQAKAWLPKQGDIFQLGSSINLCLADYSDIIIQLAKKEDVSPYISSSGNTSGGLCKNDPKSAGGNPGIPCRYITVYLMTNNGLRIIDLPLLQDNDMHSYAYPLRLLELEPYSFLQDIDIDPHGNIADEVDLGGVKLIGFNSFNDGCSNYFPSIVIPPETVVGEVTQQNIVEQSFVSECKGAFDGIDLYTATYTRNNSFPLIFSLLDYSAGVVIRTQIIPGESVRNNDWQAISFDPVSNTYQKKYLINLESPASIPGNAITIYQSLSDQYLMGELHIGSSPFVAGDLVFRYHCSVKEDGLR